jgi:EamA domain-containing membrane protein RarD
MFSDTAFDAFAAGAQRLKFATLGVVQYGRVM